MQGKHAGEYFNLFKLNKNCVCLLSYITACGNNTFLATIIILFKSISL